MAETKAQKGEREGGENEAMGSKEAHKIVKKVVRAPRKSARKAKR
jgi:hypothetical protein